MKEKIKYVGAMLICFIAVLFMQMPVLADDGVPATAWRDNAAAAFAGGSGTAADPYLITDGAQLAKVAKDVEDNVTVYKDVYFRLENDIDLSAHRWNPIGVWKWYENGASENKTFAGFLDGNGKTITGLIVDERTEKNSAGLFGNIGDNAGAATNVGAKDLNIVDARIYATDEGMERSSSAILAGYVMANFGHTIRFDNISVSGTITNTKVGKTMISGGLIGEVCRATVDNCQADVTIKGGDNTGGFVGIDASSTYTNCKVTGKVTGLWAIGGFVGYAQEAAPRTMSTFKNCVAEVDIVASDWRAGGFSGYMEKGKASSCAALGDVTSSVTGWNPKVGGFVGEIGTKDATGSAILDKCHAAGKVTAASPDYKAGGFVGTHTEGTYTECSFDSEKNPGLAAYGEGDEAAVPVEAGTTTAVSGNLCEDIYGGHAWESDYTVDVAPTCGTSGSESIHCSRCGNSKSAREIPATGSHDWQWVIDTPAAVGVAGSKHEQCSICAATKPAVTIPALEDAGASGAGSSGTETSGNTSSGTTAAGSAAAPADTNAAQPSAENNTGVTPPKTGEDPVTVVYLLLFASMIGMALVRRKKHFKDSF
jgi:hypothetical protein